MGRKLPQVNAYHAREVPTTPGVQFHRKNRQGAPSFKAEGNGAKFRGVKPFSLSPNLLYSLDTTQALSEGTPVVYLEQRFYGLGPQPREQCRMFAQSWLGGAVLEHQHIGHRPPHQAEMSILPAGAGRVEALSGKS